MLYVKHLIQSSLYETDLCVYFQEGCWYRETTNRDLVVAKDAYKKNTKPLVRWRYEIFKEPIGKEIT